MPPDPTAVMIENRGTLARTPRHDHACRAITAGIEAAHPEHVIAEQLELRDGTLLIAGETYQCRDYGNIFVVGGGNAAGAVVGALESLLEEQIDGGVVVTDSPVPTAQVDVAEGTHPLPSDANVDGTEQLLDVARTAGEDDLVLAVIGGGGSALMCAPAAGVSVAAYRELTTQLLESGASIDEINAVRKHISRIKGGQLAREISPAETAGLVFSDVVGNRLDVIASGPLSPDETTYSDALDVLERYGIEPPEAIAETLQNGRRGDRPETPGAGSPVFERVRTYILADNRTALEATADALEQCGYTPAILSAAIEGEARVVGSVHAAIARECASHGDPFEPPVALLSGGETTVTISGDGTGGPNQEFALSAAVSLSTQDIVVAAVDTDGIDGPTDAAGAILAGTQIDEGSSARAALDANDVYPYLDERETLIRTGPTGTNVNDLRLVLVGSPDQK